MPADVFISYKRNDLERVEIIARALQAKGLDVWYDAKLQAGSSFDSEITKALRSARSVLVCWSKESCESEWVRAEATEGRQRQTLVSVLLERCDPYPPFNLIHHEDLSDWRGQEDHVGWRRVLSAIGSRTGRQDLVTTGGPAPARAPAARTSAAGGAVLLAAAGLLVAAAVAGGAWWFMAGPGASAPAPVDTPVQEASAAARATEPAPEPAASAAPAPAEAEPAPASPAPAETTAAPASAPQARFRMLGDARAFGRPERRVEAIRFEQDEHRYPRAGARFFETLATDLSDSRVREIEIIAPQMQGDEAALELRERRLAALVEGFKARGAPPAVITIGYEDAEPGAYRITIYHHPDA
jgi:hypothetical protein